MNKIELNDASSFKNAISTIYSCSKNINELIDKENLALSEITDDLRWKGKTQEAIIQKQQLLQRQTCNVGTTLNNYASYLQSVLDAYVKMDAYLKESSNNLSNGN